MSCQLGKSCKQTFKLSNNKSKFPLERIHCDLWGPSPIASTQNYHFYALFVDDFTRFSWLFPLKNKSNFFECFLRFQRQVENQLERKINFFQCDGGGEFNSKVFINHLNSCGIQKQVSCPYTPEQNGVAERKHRHITETALTMIFHASLPLKLWPDVFFAAVYVINRMPLSSIKNKSPYELLFRRTPEYNGLKILGFLCFPYLRDHNKNKFERKSYPCVFIGYSPLHKHYRCLQPETNRVYTSRHVVFYETIFSFEKLKSVLSFVQENNELTTFPFNDESFLQSSQGKQDAYCQEFQPHVATTKQTTSKM